MAGERELLEAGEQALAAGEWAAAAEAFRGAIERGESGAALAGLGDALWWLGDNPAALDHCERAYAAFRREGEPARAAELALEVCLGQWSDNANVAAAAGWLARARRLVEEHELEPLRGWIHLHEALIAEPAAGESRARKALEAARLAGDVDLELCALSEIGAKLVAQGRVEEGVGYLDEAMAGSLGGEADGRGTVVYTSCVTIKSCMSSAEFERASQWVQAADRFTERFGNPFLYAQCRALYGAMLVATGDWERAEEELRTALKISRNSLPAVHAATMAVLAELRLSQGRLEEAERLVAGFEDQAAAVEVMARIHLARGRPTAAEAVLERRFAELDGDGLEGLLLLELLGEAELRQGRPEPACERGRTLADSGRDLGCDVVVARGERLRGRALVETSGGEAARPHLDAAVAVFASLGMPLETARTRLLLARTLREHAPEVAGTEARAALGVFEELGANRDADAAAGLLRELGVKAARTGARTADALTNREREVFGLLAEGLTNPEIAERLYISRRTVEDHVANVLSKLGLRNRVEAAAEAVRRTGDDVDAT